MRSKVSSIVQTLALWPDVLYVDVNYISSDEIVWSNPLIRIYRGFFSVSICSTFSSWGAIMRDHFYSLVVHYCFHLLISKWRWCWLVLFVVAAREVIWNINVNFSMKKGCLEDFVKLTDLVTSLTLGFTCVDIETDSISLGGREGTSQKLGERTGEVKLRERELLDKWPDIIERLGIICFWSGHNFWASFAVSYQDF